MGADTTVTGNPNDPAVTPQVTSQGQAVPQVGMSQQGASDAGAVQTQTPLSADEVRKKLEQDLNRLRSVKDREQAELRRKYEEQQAALQRQIDEIATKNLDEKDRALYEATRAKQEAESLRQQLEEIQASREAEQQMKAFASAFQEEFGIDPSELDFSSQEALANSAWGAVSAKFKAMKSGTTSPNTPATQTSQSRIVTGSGATPRSSRVTLEDVRKSYEDSIGRKVTDEEFWKAAERRRVDLSQVTKD